MTWLKRGVLAAAVVAVLAFIAFNIFKKQIGMAAFNAAVERNVGVDRSAKLPDGLHVYLCGSGSPLADPTRAGPCVGVLAGDRAFIFDVGSGGSRNLGSMGFPIARLETIYLTHLHSDHIDGLGELLLFSWAGGGRTEPTPIAGPVGTQQVVEGFNKVYEIDSRYRVAHHGPETVFPTGFGGVAREIDLPAGPANLTTIFEDGDLKISALRMDHNPIENAFGYRIDYKDRSISISGDTVYNPGFVAASKDVDLMLHEALNKKMVSKMSSRLGQQDQLRLSRIFVDIQNTHATPEEAARAAQVAGADQLLIYHIVPPLPVKMIEAAFLGDARSEFDGKITVGRDGMIFSLPAGSDDISLQTAF